jgi:hypothetical protein
VALVVAVGPELTPAHHARARDPVDPVLAPAVSVERGGAVRADDLQVLQPVVVADPVDVVDDQRHQPATPLLALAAELAAT